MFLRVRIIVSDRMGSGINLIAGYFVQSIITTMRDVHMPLFVFIFSNFSNHPVHLPLGLLAYLLSFQLNQTITKGSRDEDVGSGPPIKQGRSSGSISVGLDERFFHFLYLFFAASSFLGLQYDLFIA